MTNADRQKRYRAKRNAQEPENVTRVTGSVTESPESVTPVTVCDIIPEGSREDYTARPYAYAPRSEPDKLNWGPWMSSDELSKAGLKANRVSIPGDWDYEGARE